jgi:hypothetical protein
MRPAEYFVINVEECGVPHGAILIAARYSSLVQGADVDAGKAPLFAMEVLGSVPYGRSLELDKEFTLVAVPSMEGQAVATQGDMVVDWVENTGDQPLLVQDQATL